MLQPESKHGAKKGIDISGAPRRRQEIGGRIRANKRKTTLDEKRKYQPGQHGYKSFEQQELTGDDFKVSGKTHESEHTIGFEVLNRTSGEKRKGGSRAYSLEMEAPAYQEIRAMHRAHIGTGTLGASPENLGNKGFESSEQYRNAQRSLLEAGDISSAVQLNQLGYAFQPGFRESGGTREREIANASYVSMVDHMKPPTYAVHTTDVTALDPKTADEEREWKLQKAEMYGARYMQEYGLKSLSGDDLIHVLGRYGLTPDDQRKSVEYWKKLKSRT